MFLHLCVILLGGCLLHPGGVRIWEGGWSDTPQSDTTGYGQRADGTHPTRMHSCFSYFFPLTWLFGRNDQNIDPGHTWDGRWTADGYIIITVYLYKTQVTPRPVT